MSNLQRITWSHDEEFTYWATRLSIHHLDTLNAVKAQMIHLMGECGEAARALQELEGMNPRKPVSELNTREGQDNFRDELCDVMITAGVILKLVGGRPEEDVRNRLAYVTSRMREYDNKHGY